jgi:hypothetical protein
MSPTLDSLKRELEHFGQSNDEVHTERPLRMLNITRVTGEFLGVLVRAIQAKRILEIGTSNGHSTQWRSPDSAQEACWWWKRHPHPEQLAPSWPGEGRSRLYHLPGHGRQRRVHGGEDAGRS